MPRKLRFSKKKQHRSSNVSNIGSQELPEQGVDVQDDTENNAQADEIVNPGVVIGQLIERLIHYNYQDVETQSQRRRRRQIDYMTFFRAYGTDEEYNREMQFQAERNRSLQNQTERDPIFQNVYLNVIGQKRDNSVLCNDQTETPSQRRRRRQTDWMRLHREFETDDEHNRRMQLKAERDRLRRQNETALQQQVRLQSQTERDRTRRENESQEQRQIRLETQVERDNIRTQNESVEQRQIRIDTQAERVRIQRQNETEEQRQIRLDTHAERVRIKRKNETFTQRQERLQQQGERNRRAINLVRTHLAATRVDVQEHQLGPMNMVCEYCQAVHFREEMPSDKKFVSCCHKGKVALPALAPYPDLLMQLLTKQHVYSNNFITNIRSYNSALSFASIGANIKLPPGRGPYCFRIHGQIYHKISHVNPGDDMRYGQLYFLDTHEALAQRTDFVANDDCLVELMGELDVLIRDINPFAQAYKFMREVEEGESEMAELEGRTPLKVVLQIHENRQGDQRRYNLPTANEVAVVFKGTDGVPPQERDIRIYLRGGQFLNLSLLSPNCDPLCYALLFPFGEPGWQCEIRQTNNRASRVSMLQFYAYRLAVRNEAFSPILNAGKLTQQYIVDAYVKVESDRLNYIRTNQRSLRVEHYQGLIDHLENEAITDNLRLGRMIILPSTFVGSPWAMRQHYQDAMSIVTKYGRPDLFVTFTCNAKWPEIQNNLAPWQSAEHRPDLVVRVFNLKLKELMNDIKVKHVLGVPVAHLYVVEFQKRGLPHAHILITLRDEDKLRGPEEIDRLVCAEFPNPEAEPRLYEIVCNFMIHGPCGTRNMRSVCMKYGKCTKYFPKDFCLTTEMNSNGFPVYQRRDTGHTVMVRNAEFDNRFIVPYNRWLLLKYNAHINIEICTSVKSIKYLCNYLHKGHDCTWTSVSVQSRTDGNLSHDEVSAYEDNRIVTPPEAIWRLFEFKLHNQSHHVIRLAVHLPNQQDVYFADGEELAAAERAGLKDTTLTAWFRLNQVDPSANGYLYGDIPYHYVFNAQKVWVKRSRGEKDVLPRLYSVSPMAQEKYYLRLLLLHVKGAKTYEDVRTYEGILYDTFQEAAAARNLLADDAEWKRCLQEAVIEQMPRQLRRLFAIICVLNEIAEPLQLWLQFKEFLIEDYTRLYENQDLAEQYALRDMELILNQHGTCCRDLGLPEPREDLPVDVNTMYDVDEERSIAETDIERLNQDQRAVFTAVMSAVENEQCPDRYFFLDGPGGSGKTFLYNAIISFFRGRGQEVIAVALTGIAAMLLKGGKTAHSQFRIPVPVVETSTCNLKHGDERTEKIKRSKLIIWDEITMAPGLALEAVDRSLRDILQNNKPFGGKVVLLGGDFRQCLPVVPRGHRGRIVQSCVKSSHLWQHFRHMKLNINMRANPEELQFSDWLLRLGEGKLTNDSGLDRDMINIPNDCITNNVVQDIFENTNDSVCFTDRAILCPKNVDCLKLNEMILDKIPGESKSYCSVDSVVSEEDDAAVENYNLEFLNQLTPSGMPPHKLTLKEGSIVILLRNIDLTVGMCNGARLIIKKLLNNFLDAEIAVGSFKGHRVFIPRIELAPSDANLPFVLKRRQFPIRLAYAMTINKAQGQTLEKVGVYLPRPVFAHGQLYVAFSRAKSLTSIKVQVDQTPEQGKLLKNDPMCFTRNVVYREVL